MRSDSRANMKTPRLPKKHPCHGARRPQHRRLLLEPLEGRTLLAATNLAAIAGTVFTDSNGDGSLSAGEVGVDNVTVRLYRDGGNGTLETGTGGDTLVATKQTQNGGQYRFEDLTVGTYLVQQSPAPGLLLRPDQAVVLVDVSATEVKGVLGTAIDTFDNTLQMVEASFTNGRTVDSLAANAPEALGGNRELFIERTSAAGRVALAANGNAPLVLAFEFDSGSEGRQSVVWDGPDNDATTINYSGLGGADLTHGGRDVGLRMMAGSDHPGFAKFRVYSGTGNVSEAVFPITNIGDDGNTYTDGKPRTEVILRFSQFSTVAGTGARFDSVGALELRLELEPASGAASASNGQLDQLGTVGPTVKNASFANLNPLSIGDRVWRDVNNDGLLNNGEAGIANVVLNLYEDKDRSGGLTAGDGAAAATATTDATGTYRFTNLLPGAYVVQVAASNFGTGGPLSGLASSKGNQPAPDPGNDVNNDDNGAPGTGQDIVAAVVTLTAGGEPTNDGDQDANTNLTVDFGFAAIADLEVEKSDNPDPVGLGENLVYTLVVRNNGPSPATGVVVTDQLPSHVTYVSYTASPGVGTVSHTAGIVTANVGSLAPGGQAQIQITVRVDSAATSPLSNTATVRANEYDPDPSNDSDTEETGVTLVDVTIDKTDLADPVVAGETLTYRLLVTNRGPSTATNVTVRDVLPAGLTYEQGSSTASTPVAHAAGTVTASLGTLAVNGTATVTIVARVGAGVTGQISNTATVTATERETDETNNSDSEPTQIVPRIDLAIDKTGAPATVGADGRVTYTLRVTNNIGPSNATGVTVVDTLPTGLFVVNHSSSQGTTTVATTVAGETVTAAIGNLAVGGVATVTIEASVPTSMSTAFTNTATVTGNESERDLTNNIDSATTQPAPHVDLVITKTDAPDPVIAGQQLTYRLNVSNLGPSNATNVVVTDTLPTGVTYRSATPSQGTVSQSGSQVTVQLGNLAVAGTAWVDLVVDVLPTTRGTLVNTASVAATEIEVNANNNTANVSTDVTPKVDLTIVKADSPDPVAAGGTLTYTFTVTNKGPSTATGVTVVDTLPTGLSYSSGSAPGTISNANGTVTATVGTLAANGTATVTIVTQVATSAVGPLNNEARVSAAETDIDPTNDKDAEATVIDPLTASISGVVYVDRNNDGQKNSGEEAIAGAIVQLTGTDSAGTAVNRQATTGADGSYSFSNLRAGTYKVAETQPTAYQDGRDTVGTVSANSTVNDEFSAINLDPGAAARNYLFGERPLFFSKRWFLG